MLTGPGIGHWIPGLVLILAALVGRPCKGQPVLPVFPNQVVDVRALLRAHTLRQDFSFGGIAQNHGRWAAYANFLSTKTSMVITGSDSAPPRFSGFVEGLADQIAMDPSGEVYLCMELTPDIDVLDAALQPIGRARHGDASLVPVPSPVGVFWAYGFPVASILQLGVGFVRPAGAIGDAMEQQPLDPTTPDYGTIAALPNGTAAPRWIRVKQYAEEVAVFENNGRLLAKNKINLDAAYHAFGYAIPQPTVDAVRIGWIAVSATSELYAGLSSVPFGKPLPVAVIDPLTGKLLRVVALVLPRSAERVGRYNPLGFVRDTRTAMGDRLVILDTQVGLLAVYTKY